MKILYITTVGRTMTFFKSFIEELVSDGHTVDIATGSVEEIPNYYSDMGCANYPLSCSRSPFRNGNIKAIKEIKRIVQENQYDIVHCHTPIAAACTRFACKGLRKQRKNTEHPLRVFYTAHGFHFYKGAPKKNWIIYYPVEWLCAHWTDTLITINKEDYEFAKNKFSFGGKCRIKYVPGVGIDVEKFANTVVDRKAKRAELGVPKDAFLLLSVGELNENKNHQIVIRALAELMQTEEGKAKNFYYIIAGEGPLHNQLQELIDELGLTNRVFLLGYRKDCAELYKTANLFVHPSLREGLPVSVMEAQAAGLNCIGSKIRGTSDLIEMGNLFDLSSIEDIKKRINSVQASKSYATQFDIKSINKILKRLYY